MDMTNSAVSADNIWVFGYGSLTWKPDFKYARRVIGHIKGYKRRFWQGTDTHRGTKSQVGRVATLVEDTQGMVWGVAYHIIGEKSVGKVLGGLTNREITLGGYDVTLTSFHPQNANAESRLVLVYMATENNSMYLGDTDVETMATQIHMARGFSGTNTEYVTKLADYVRNHIPEDKDAHLFALDKRLRELERMSYTKNRFNLKQLLHFTRDQDINNSDGETDVDSDVESITESDVDSDAYVNSE